MAEYRKGSILARIEELEVATHPIFRFENMREKIEYYKAVGELESYKEIRAMVEARRDELKNPNYREGLGAVHERKRDSWKIDELTWLLGDGEKEKG